MFAHAAGAASPSFIDSALHFVWRTRAALASAVEANRVYGELSRLSADQLQARGLVREDLPRMTLRALTHASSL